jgi:DNA repair protein RAD51
MNRDITKILEKLGARLTRGDLFKEKYYSISWRITTGSTELDKLLDGGIYPYKVYEFFGAAGTGKTHLAMQLAVTSLIEDEKIKYNSIYIDTERGFNIQKIAKIASRYIENPSSALKHIYYSFLNDPEDLIKRLNNVRKISNNIRLLIIDNIAVPLQNLYNKDPSIISYYIRSVMRTLSELINDLSLSAVITNRVYSSLSPLTKNAYQPYGGVTLEGFIDKEILLIKENNIIKAIDISDIKAIALFKISDRGIVDI